MQRFCDANDASETKIKEHCALVGMDKFCAVAEDYVHWRNNSFKDFSCAVCDQDLCNRGHVAVLPHIGFFLIALAFSLNGGNLL